ncbi:CoA transferase [Dactylosporangium roseum]
MVLDLCDNLAGAYCARLLRDAAATVLRPHGQPIHIEDGGTGSSSAARDALARMLNARKEIIADDEVAAAIDRADVVIDSATWSGYDAAGAFAARPGLAAVTVTEFGLSGPWAGRDGGSAIRQAMAGSTYWRGDESLPPVMAGGDMEQFLAGAYAAAAAVAAVRQSRRTGMGDHLDLSLFEVTNLGLTTLGPTLASMWGKAGEDFPHRSLQIPAIERVKDGWVGLCTISARQRQDLMLLIGRPDLADDEALSYAGMPTARSAGVRRAIEDWTESRTGEEVIDAASALRIPVAPIGNGATLLDNEHLDARGFFQPTGTGLRQPGAPFRFHPVEPPAGAREGGGRPESSAPVAAGDPDGTGHLDGLRVLDLTAWWAGPAASHLLAAFGADVVKVESVSHPDGMRYSFVVDPGAHQWWERAPVFFALNTNKRGITLDLTTDRGRELLQELAANADVLIENFSARVLDSFGLDWSAIRARNPGLTVVRMPAFGLDGPWRDRTAFAQTIEQCSGLAWITGHPQGPPVAPRGICDPLAGIHAAFACLSALEGRDRGAATGVVEVSMLEPAVIAAAGQVLAWQLERRLPERLGNGHPGHCPQGVYPTADGAWVSISVRDRDGWRALARQLHRPDWLDVRWDSAEARRAESERIDTAITGWCQRHDAATAVARLVAGGVPAARVDGSGRALRHPQFEHRHFFEPVAHEVAGTHPVPGLPFRSTTFRQPWNRRPAPTLGQHTEEVLHNWLGMSASSVAGLTAAGISGTWPTNVDAVE